jgi:hypothetical protein
MIRLNRIVPLLSRVSTGFRREAMDDSCSFRSNILSR